MKGLSLGDIFVPSSQMIKIFSTEGVRDKITDIVATDFKSKSQEDISIWSCSKITAERF